MNPALEIILPVGEPAAALAATAASLTAQTDRQFSVLLSHSGAGSVHVDQAVAQFAAAGIAVRCIQSPPGLQRLELWNWAHARGESDWLKLLLPGEQLRPAFVARFKERIAANPKANFIRCDAELPTEWGTMVQRMPAPKTSLTPAEVLAVFPNRIQWLSHPVNVAYSRAAWLAAGGYSTQLPARAVLNLNVSLALHHGVENIAEPLAIVNSTDARGLNERKAARVNDWLELWLVLRQAANYSRAAGLPWPTKWLLCRAIVASLGSA